MNSHFIGIDMTEYDYDWPNVNEVGELKFVNHSKALDLEGQELWPDDGELPESGEIEVIPPNITSRTHREMVEARSAEEEEEEEEDEDEDEDEDEEGEEGEGEEGEGEGEEEEEEEEENEDPGAVPQHLHKAPDADFRYFMHDEKMRDKYNEVELDSFMKLLNIKPHAQWEDDRLYHYKISTKAYEDEGQEMDPYFHLLAEVERRQMERTEAFNFRQGTEIKLLLDPKKKPRFSTH